MKIRIKKLKNPIDFLLPKWGTYGLSRAKGKDIIDTHKGYYFFWLWLNLTVEFSLLQEQKVGGYYV
jgi:hypothetical protein